MLGNPDCDPVMSSPLWQTVRSVALLLAVASSALLGAQRAGADIIHFKDGMKTVCQGKAWEEKDEVRCEYGDPPASRGPACRRG